MKNFLVHLFALLMAWTAAEAVGEDRSTAFNPGERVSFLGDSITHGGLFIAYLEMMTAAPMAPRISNCGLYGDTCAGVLAAGRLDWDLAPQKPDRVFVMFGMNDVRRQLWKDGKPSDEIAAKRRQSLADYAKNLRLLVDKLLSHGLRVTLMTPSPYDQYGTFDDKAIAFCNEPGLASCAETVRNLAREKELGLVDLHAPLTARLRSGRYHQLCGPDRVHPVETGASLIAAAILLTGGSTSEDLDTLAARIRSHPRAAAAKVYASDMNVLRRKAEYQRYFRSLGVTSGDVAEIDRRMDAAASTEAQRKNVRFYRWLRTNEKYLRSQLEKKRRAIIAPVSPDALGLVDPMIGTEGVGTEYGGMMPMTGVPFGSMHLVPATRTNGVSRTSFNALDRELIGFILTRQPAIWMGEWGPVRIHLERPLPIESIEARPHRTRVRAGGHVYELTASSHVAYLRSDDPNLGCDLPESGTTIERTFRTSQLPIPNFRNWFVTKREGNVLKVAVSLIGEAEARRSLATELPPDFDAAAESVGRIWNEAFSRVHIEAPESVRRIFYTAFYHSLLAPRDVTEFGRHYSAMDDRVHDGAGFTCFSLWDTYRAEHPWLTLVAPDRVGDMMQSLVNMAEEGGWLPLWPNPGYTGQMIGAPAEIVLAEAYVKGLRGFDADKAWQYVLKNATQPQVGDLAQRWPGTLDDPSGPPETRAGLTRYQAAGYVAVDETNESVSRTLDYSLADSSVSRLAAALGKTDEAQFFAARAKSYTNLWNAAVNRFWPRRADGRWVEPKMAGKAYTETDEFSARWCVPHDVAGLVSLFGGREAFERELDRFFETGFFVTDTVGNKSVHGNETCHHVAYLYNRIGAYDKTARHVRDILTRCYSTDRRGFDGNEDCGQMSAWFLLSALGFYPLDPASGEYELGAPLVESATIRFEAPYPSATLKIVAKNYAPDRWRVARVTFNGRVLSDRKVRHADLVKGGNLTFEFL